jgi:protein involved in polysaccharide export with SLBB domain
MKYIYTIIFAVFLVLNAQTVEQIKKQLNDAGVTPDQAKQMARDQGYTDSQIEAEARARGIDIDGASTEADIQPFGELQGELGSEESTVELADEDDVLSLETITGIGAVPIGFFGYQIFSGDPSAFQASTFGAVDPNYNIGPGDQIIVMLWGESQFRQEFNIDREGYVFVPEVGQIFVNGLNLEALEKKFFQILSKVYSTLKPATGKPTTFMDISLGNLRPLRIIILGEVAQPGAYSVSPSTSLSSSLYYFRGPTTRGSLRDIRLLRKGKQVGSIDFYDYLLSGNTPDDPRLQLDDVVFVPPRGKTVTIHGEINRQGIYELKEMEGLKDLLQIAGDLPVTAYMKRAQISRIVPVDDRTGLGMDRMVIDIDLEAAIADNKETELRDGDVLEIYSIEDLEKNYVSVLGSSVMRPGRYQLLPDMRVLDLINAADGLLNDAYLPLAHIMRLNDDLTSDLITINLRKAISGDMENNISLQFRDGLTVYNKNFLTNIFTNVYINGSVKYPGSYSLENNKKLSDLILAAGGFGDGINKVKITIARINPDSFLPILYTIPTKGSGDKFIQIYSIENPENEINKFTLKSRDLVNVYPDPRDKLPGIVTITGAVYFPGDYPITSNKEKVSDIINRAGGLLSTAYPMASTLNRGGQTIRLSFAEIINNPNSKENFIVMENDQISISVRPNFVQMIGEVQNSGIYKYYDNYNLMDYINIAGGFTTKAEYKEIWITYSNGTSKKFKRFLFNPKVYDGSVITVGRKEETEPFDGTEYAKEMTAILANLAQVLLLYAAVR